MGIGDDAINGIVNLFGLDKEKQKSVNISEEYSSASTFTELEVEKATYYEECSTILSSGIVCIQSPDPNTVILAVSSGISSESTFVKDNLTITVSKTESEDKKYLKVTLDLANPLPDVEYVISCNKISLDFVLTENYPHVTKSLEIKNLLGLEVFEFTIVGFSNSNLFTATFNQPQLASLQGIDLPYIDNVKNIVGNNPPEILLRYVEGLDKNKFELMPKKEVMTSEDFMGQKITFSLEILTRGIYDNDKQYLAVLRTSVEFTPKKMSYVQTLGGAVEGIRIIKTN